MAEKASGPTQAISEPVTTQKISPMPVMPRTLRTTGRMPPGR